MRRRIRQDPPRSRSSIWSSTTRRPARSTTSRFRIARGSITGLLGRQRRRQDHDHRDDHGADAADLRPRVGARPSDAERALPVLGRMNFESPYVDMPMRLTVRQNLTVFGRLYAVEHLRERIDGAGRRPRPRTISSTGQRQAVGRAEDPRRAGEGADQRARAAAARRADRLARSRHGRLGARASGDLSQDRTTPPSCSPRTTCSRSSGCATASSS